MDTNKHRNSPAYLLVTLITILALLWPWQATPTQAGSGGPIGEGLGALGSAHPATQYVIPCPGDLGVNTWNGNLMLPRTDLYLAARGIPLELEMIYNSQRRNDGLTTYGFGWRMNYHVAYTLDPYNGNFVVTWGDGNTSALPVVGDHLYAPASTPELAAVRYAPGKYRVRLHDGTTYYFDNPTHRRVTRMEDGRGNALIFIYDGGGTLLQVTNLAGGFFNFLYTAGRLTDVLDSTGRSVHYQYDINGDQMSFTDVMGVNLVYAYAEHLLVNVMDAQGLSVMISYATPADLPTARHVAQVQAPPLIRSFGYIRKSGDGLPSARTLVTDTVGVESRVNIFFYDNFGKLRNTQDALGKRQTYQWDYYGNLIAYTDRNGRKTTYAYDGRGNLVKMTNALGQITTYTWHAAFNSLTSITNARGQTTHYTYDARGNLAGLVDAQGNTTNFEYDDYGQMVKLTDGRGHTLSYTYDLAGNRTSFTNALGEMGQYLYDPAGNLTHVIGPDGAQATLAYNAAGENTLSTDALGGVRQVQYTQAGRVAAVIDELGRLTSYGYDPRNRLAQVNDALGGIRQYIYDGFGDLTTATDPNNHSTTYTYDAAGRLSSATDALGRLTVYGYDNEGNLISLTTPDGQVTTFAYDALNRHIHTSYADGSQVDLTYDAAGNVLTAAGLGYSYQYTYDENGHVTSVQDLILGTLTSYTYDPNGNRRSMTDPDGGMTYYFYDALDRLERLVNPLGETTTWQYNRQGWVARVTLGNDNWVEMSYDALGRVTRLTHFHANGDVVLRRYSYTYDAAGNRTSVTEDNYGTTTYGYDALNRLVQVSGPAGTATYTYDAAGNRLSMTEAAGVTSYTYDAGDQLLMEISPSLGTIQYQYDLRGNQISRAEGAMITNYLYDSANRLTQVDLPGGEAMHYTYDQSGLRRSRTVGTATTYYVYDFVTQNLLLERQAGLTTARYTTGLGLDELLSQARTGGSSFYHTDALGSVTALSDEDGLIEAVYRYDAFGRPTTESGSVINLFRFSGRPWDHASKLYDLRQRVYDPTSGRFLTRDPLDAPLLPDLAAQPYAYAGNNPTTHTDRRGLIWGWIEAGINAVSAGLDAWANGGSLADVVQAVGVSGAVDAVNALLGGVIPGPLRDGAKNLINQLIDWGRGKRCGVNWGEVVKAIGLGLVNEIAGALFKAGAIGNDTFSKILEQIHGFAQGKVIDAAAEEALPEAEPGPCHKRRQQKPVQREAPRRRPPQRPSRPPGRSAVPVGAQQGRHGGGSSGPAQVTQLTPNPIRSGAGQPLTHRYQFHNVTTEPLEVGLSIYYNTALDNPAFTASQPPEYAEIDTSELGTYMDLMFTGVPSTTLVVTTTGQIAVTQPVTPGQVIKPLITLWIGNDAGRPDSPTEVGDGGGNPAPALALRKADGPDPFTAGAVQTYTVEVENTGGVALSNVVVTETYPAEVTYLAATPPPVVGNARWHLGNLAPHEIKLITITVQTAATLLHGAVLTNTVQARSDQTPIQTTIEKSTARNQPRLEVTKTATPWPPQAGGLVTFTLDYANTGAVPIENLMAVESYDPRLSFVSATPAPAAGSEHIWSLGTLGAGASGQIVVVMQALIKLPYPHPWHNEVVFFGDRVEPALAAAGYFATVGPSEGGTIVYVDAQGMTTTVQIPAGAVTETTRLVFTPLPEPSHPLAGNIRFAGHAFNLEAWRNGQRLEGFAFLQPISITIVYSAADAAGMDEASLFLDFWDAAAGQWADAAATCAPPSAYQRQPDENWLALPICHLSDFALTGPGQTIYLPLVVRKR